MEGSSLSPCSCCQKRGWLEQRLRVAAALAIVRLRQRGVLIHCAEETTTANEECNLGEENGRENENGCTSNLNIVSFSRTARILQSLTSSSLTPGERDPAYHTSGLPRNSCLFPPLDLILSALCHHIIDLDAQLCLGQSREVQPGFGVNAISQTDTHVAFLPTLQALPGVDLSYSQASSALQNLMSQLNELWPGTVGLWSRVRRVAIWFTQELLKLLLKDCELGRFPRQRQRAAVLSKLASAQLLQPLLTSEILNSLEGFSNIIQETLFYENSIFILELLTQNDLLVPLAGSSSRLLHSPMLQSSCYPLYHIYTSHMFR